MKLRLALWLAVLSSCGPTTYREFCAEAAAETCRTQFRCDRARAVAAWGKLDACVDDLANAGDCRGAATKRCYLEPELTKRCLDDMKKVDCEESGATPTSCRAVICEDASVVRCTEAATTFESTGCARERNACSDGRRYVITCGATKCTCFRGQDEGVDFDRGTFCSDGADQQDAAFRFRCGYQF